MPQTSVDANVKEDEESDVDDVNLLIYPEQALSKTLANDWPG